MHSGNKVSLASEVVCSSLTNSRLVGATNLAQMYPDLHYLGIACKLSPLPPSIAFPFWRHTGHTMESAKIGT